MLLSLPFKITIWLQSFHNNSNQIVFFIVVQMKDIQLFLVGALIIASELLTWVSSRQFFIYFCMSS